ncbi:putative acyl-CoA N-acyltransferase [Septoria linicola]|nr:putative acyl-CoA N-acyltransferase [Septoria linicola]
MSIGTMFSWLSSLTGEKVDGSVTYEVSKLCCQAQVHAASRSFLGSMQWASEVERERFGRCNISYILPSDDTAVHNRVQAVVGDSTVGHALASLFRQEDGRGGVLISQLAVFKSHRKLRIATQMLEEIREIVDEYWKTVTTLSIDAAAIRATQRVFGDKGIEEAELEGVIKDAVARLFPRRAYITGNCDMILHHDRDSG